MEAQKQGLMCIVQRRIIKQALLGLEWPFVSFFHSWSFFFFDRASPVCPQPAARAAGVRARGGGQSDAPDAVPTRTAQKSI